MSTNELDNAIIESSLATNNAKVAVTPELKAEADEFQLGTAQQLSTIATPSPGFNIVEFTEEEDTLGFVDGMTDGSIFGGAARLWRHDMVSDKLDPEFAPKDYVQTNYTDKMERIAKMAAQGDPGSQTLLKMITTFPANAGLVDHYFRVADEHYKKLEQSVSWGYGAGLLAGVVTDGLLDLAVTRGTLTGTRVVASSRLARMAAAKRTALIAGTESGVDEFLRSLGDVAVTDTDVYLMTGIGSFAGAIIGGAAPRFVGNIFTEEQIAARLDAAARMQDEIVTHTATDGDLSAAKTRELIRNDPYDRADTNFAVRGTDPAVAKRLAPRFIRSPKSLVRQLFAEGTAAFKKNGMKGQLHAARLLNRLYSQSTMTSDDIMEVPVGRLETAEGVMQGFRAKLVTHQKAAHDVYEAFLEEAFGVGKVMSTLKNDFMVGRLTPDEIPTMDQLREVADVFAQDRADGTADWGRLFGGNFFGGEVPADKQQMYKTAIEKLANMDDKYYLEIGKDLERNGLLKPDEVKPGYRPQVWNLDAIQEAPEEFENFLLDVIRADQPTEEFIRTMNYYSLDETGEQAVKKPWLNEGETWDEFKVREPQRAGVIQDEWEQMTLHRNMDEIAKEQRRLSEKLNQWQADTADEVLENMRQRLGRMQVQKNKLDVTLQNIQKENSAAAQTGGLRVGDYTHVAGRLSRLEKKMGDANLQIADIKKMNDQLYLIEEQLAKVSDDAGRAARREIYQLSSDLDMKAAKLMARTSHRNIAKAITDQIMKHRSYAGFHLDDVIVDSAHFKHRALNLKDRRHLPGTRKFMVRNPGDNVQRYTRSVTAQGALRKVYNPLLQQKDPEYDPLRNKNQFFDRMKAMVDEGFEADIETLGIREGADSKNIAAIRKQQKQVDETFEKAFGEITGTNDSINPGDSMALNMRRYVGIANNITAATGLGFVAASMITDLAISNVAGGRVGVGFQGLVKRMFQKGIFKEIAEDDDLLSMTIFGHNAYDASLLHNRLDIPDEIDFPGSMSHRISRGSGDLATKQMHVAGLHALNRMIRSSFGLEFSRKVGVDMLKYDELKPSLKQFYASKGIGDIEARQLGEMLEKHPRMVRGIRLPDSKAWMETPEGKESLGHYMRLIREAGNEALLDPDVGDRPFMSSTPIGKLFLLFQSFTFTAGNKWLAPLLQNGMLNPADARIYMGSLLAIGLAAAGEGVRAAARGEEQLDRFMNQMEDDPEGWWDLVKTGYLRSPFAVGMLGVGADFFGTWAAEPVNNLFGNMTGSSFDLMNPEYVKLRQRQGFAGLLGPSFGLANSGLEIGSDFANGEFEEAFRSLRYRTPFLNTLILWSLTEKLKQLGD